MESCSSCQICREKPWKYKCPVCVVRYCSVACFKSHKEDNCKPAVPLNRKEDGELSSSDNEAVATLTTENIEEDDIVSVEKLHQLGQSKEIHEMLKNPHLRDILQSIYRSSNPEVELGDALDIPIATEFADECLKICGRGGQTK
eukprot:m.56846 g.56846  ORF g.56846 m.56846 type:complete len:144 (+) comp34661_c0_seq6:17-448(+)